MTKFVIFFSVVIFPFLLWLGQLFDFDVNRQIYDLSIGFCVLFSLTYRLIFRSYHGSFSFEAILAINALFIYAISMMASDYLGPDVYWFNLFMELKPLYYLACSFWFYSIKTGKEVDFFLFSAGLLSCFIIIDFVLKLIETNTISRATFSGEVNYESVLLLISFAISLKDRVLLTFLILIAICATMSRTALLILPSLYYVVKRPGVLRLFFVICVISVPVVISTLSRDMALELESIDRFWMWKSALNTFSHNPYQFLFGFDLSRPLPVEIPSALSGLHDIQIENKDSNGFYAFSFHAFWLRSIATWGFAIIGLGFSFVYYKLLKSNSYMGFPLIIITFFSGFTMGVFYVSHLSVVLLIMIMFTLGANKKCLI